ncbi:MAG: hypothetical protein AB7O97_05555 [Planctomycetota bacterium]
MNHPVHLFPLLLLAATSVAQSPPLLFTTSQTETTLSGSGGTVLQTLRPNEVALFDLVACPSLSAEKWAPLTCYSTMAGDTDANSVFYEPGLFGSIDALCDVPNLVAGPSQRTVFISPSVAMGTNVSGAPGLRPGDTGRIVRNAFGDGQVEYFLRAEDVQLALGLPASPIVVDVDAIAVNTALGVYFSLNQNLGVATTCGATFVQDGDVIVIPATAITWTFDLRVAAVVPGSAEIAYTEAQMDAFVAASGITDRFGVCVTTVGDLEGLEVDPNGLVGGVPGCTGTVTFVPDLMFTASTLTGGGVCTTTGGGQIWGNASGCVRLGSNCGSGPTLGNQVGLLPPVGPNGIPSYLNAIALVPTHIYVIEPQQHVVPIGSPFVCDMYSPAGFNLVYAAIAPLPVAPSIGFPNPFFPDVYVLSWAWSTSTLGGFQTFATPPVPFPVKLVWQAGTILGNQIIVSTPATTEA